MKFASCSPLLNKYLKFHGQAKSLATSAYTRQNRKVLLKLAKVHSGQCHAKPEGDGTGFAVDTTPQQASPSSKLNSRMVSRTSFGLCIATSNHGACKVLRGRGGRRFLSLVPWVRCSSMAHQQKQFAVIESTSSRPHKTAQASATRYLRGNVLQIRFPLPRILEVRLRWSQQA